MNHEYSPDHTTAGPDGKPVACVVCGLPKPNRVHRDVPVDVLSHRILGEGEPSDVGPTR